MKLFLKTIALGAIAASMVAAAPVEKRDSNATRIIACFAGLVLTGAWPGSCQAAIAVNVGLIKTIAVNQMTMDFTPEDPWAPITSSNSVVATMLSIPGISLPITSIRQHIILIDNGVQIGNIDTPWAGASVSGSTLTTSFASSTLNVFSGAHTAFTNFIGSISTKAEHPLTLRGTVDAKLDLGFLGEKTIPGIGFEAVVPMTGLSNLDQMKYTYLIDTNFDTPGFVYLTTIINIVNPSHLTLKLGDVAFDTAYEGGRVGISSIKGLTLVPGDNFVLSATGLDMTLPASTNFLVNLSNQDNTLVLTGFEGTSSDVALNAGLGVMTSNLVVPKGFEGSVMSQPPSKNWSIKTLPSTNSDRKVEIKATFQSPYYGYPVEMVSASGSSGLNSVFVTNISPKANSVRLFDFDNSLTYSVSGTNAVTVTFTASLGVMSAGNRAAWEEVVAYGAANGHIPIRFDWMPDVIVNNDGINRQVEWTSTATGVASVNIAVGTDFGSILN